MVKSFKVDVDHVNKYVRDGLTIDECRRICGDWHDEVSQPHVRYPTPDVCVIDDSVSGIGTKGRWADFIISCIEQDELVYVAPRFGWAGISLAALAAKHGKKLTLFMPAAKRVSDHQLVCIERGAVPVFRRVAAMPVLNGMAKAYAQRVGGYFIPFGLDHPYTAAAGVVSTLQHFPDAPDAVWTVVSTGVLTRTLQIAWPTSRFTGVAVARNLHPGELGSAIGLSYYKEFARSASIDTKEYGFDSAPNYDAKGFEMMMAINAQGTFWNVAGDIKPTRLKHEDIDSDRLWGEIR